MIFLCFCEITSFGSASLKLCVCIAASPWSHSSFPDSQCDVHFLIYIFQGIDATVGDSFAPLGEPHGKGTTNNRMNE